MLTLKLLTDLIGKAKDDPSVVALTRAYRTYETQAPDLEESEETRRWIVCESEGFDLGYRGTGKITTVFIFVKGDELHHAYTGRLPGLTRNCNQSDVRRVFGEPSWTRNAGSVPVLGDYGPADRYDSELKSLHFEYLSAGSQLSRITIMSSDVVPK